jgi:hypothetical protein
MAARLKELWRRLDRNLDEQFRSLDEDESKPRTRRRMKILLAVILLLLAYPVLGTLALWTGLVERIVRSEDLRVEIDNPAYTIWPGRIHMKRVRIFMNGDAQFILSGDDLTGNIALLELFKRRFHVTELRAHGVVYQMRVQVKTTRGIEERVAAYPPLEGLPGANVVDQTAAERMEKRGAPWTVQVEGIDVSVRELWFFEYRYLGKGRLLGGFLRGPGRMRVDTSIQHLGPGELRFGKDQLISRNLRGGISATIPELDPDAHADESFFEFVTARVQIAADILSLRHVGAYAHGVQFRDGQGPLDVDLFLERGNLGNQSRFRFDTEKIRLLGKGVGLRSDWHLDMRVASEAEAKTAQPEAPRRALPHLRSNAEATYVSFRRERDRDFTVQFRDHEESLTLDSTALGRKTGLERASLNFPKIVTHDIDDLGSLAKDDSPIRTEQGTARGSLRLESGPDRVLHGPFELHFDGVKLVVAGVNLSGDGRARSQLRIDLDKKQTLLSDVGIVLRDVGMHVGDEDVDGWWMKLGSKRARAWGLPPERFETTFAIVAKDAEPLLEALAEKDKLNDLVAKFTSLDDLRVKATLRVSKNTMDLMLETLESDVWDVSGRFYTHGKKSRSALLVGGKAVSIGIASDGEHSEIKPFAGTDWLNAKLREFPKPVEVVRPPKP